MGFGPHLFGSTSQARNCGVSCLVPSIHNFNLLCHAIMSVYFPLSSLFPVDLNQTLAMYLQSIARYIACNLPSMTNADMS